MQCEICKQKYYTWSHTCPPVWQVYLEQYPDYIYNIYADTAEEAAEIAVEKHDERYSDYDDKQIAYLNSSTIVIAENSTGGYYKLEVEGQWMPQYKANVLH